MPKSSPTRFSALVVKRVTVPTIIIPKLHTTRFVIPKRSEESAVGFQLPNYQPGVPSTRAFDFARDGVEVIQSPNSPKLPAIQPKFAPVPKIGNALCRFAPVPQFGQVQPVVQAKSAAGMPRFYPNLNPAAAALKVDPGEFLHLQSGFDESFYRIRRGGDHGLLVPNSKFIFVRTMDGDTVMHQRYRHPVLAQGKPVLYAGEAYFNNGKLDWWSNGSGNYRPDSDHAEQASLPMERFFTYEDVLKGKTK